MDYVTRQFINLSKKLRKDLRILITNLTSALEKQTEAIRKASRASEQQQTPPPPATVIHLPERIEVHQNADEARKEDNYRRATFFISSLTLAAIVAYAILVN